MYMIVEWPGRKPLQVMTTPEQHAFWKWFLDEKAHRIEILKKYTRQSQDWNADFTPSSLRPLMRWFIRVASSAYADRIKAGQAPEDAARWDGTWLRSNYDPSPLTISIAFDIAIYLGEMIIRTEPGAQWVHCVRPKNSAYYGQPCLKGVRPWLWSPMPSCVGLAGRIISDQVDEGALDEIYASMAKNAQ